ncbi:hypothetical protein KJ365_00805 [Glaciecola sp. XM2]|uniref:hypothetical protein n=1 Tax=Glaciecola sp. XM2 TaxID=1914931 RepID=UPI001BDF0B94|nr:hypothetical protein [Glaciecola sp. XM2]MBT1449406.1 hypothetical protein [Glaciecola sp. XM2]
MQSVSAQTASDRVFVVPVSAQLQADFDLLRQAQLYDQQGGQRDKFTAHTIDKLAQHIVCRHYSGLCYELAHLSWAVVNTGSKDALLDYFYIQENVYASGFTQYFQKIGPCKLPEAQVCFHSRESDATAHNAIEITIHQHRFSITASRINILAAMLEWLLNFVPNLLVQIDEALNGKSHNAIQSLASQLQKEIYEYLNKHLVQAKAQAKFHYMSAWLQEREVSQFTDQSLLELWIDAKNRDGMSRFTTVVKDVFQFQEAITKTHTEKALMQAQDISEQDQAEWLFETLDTITEPQISLAQLTNTPKLLSKQQAEKLQLLSDYSAMCQRFPMTWLRYDVFGQYQANCIQAQRNQNISAEAFTLPNENLYGQLLKHFQAQLKLNEHTCLAVIHILLQDNYEGVQTLLSLDTFNMSGDDTETLKRRCQQAFLRNNRQGFTDKTIVEDKAIYVDNTLALLLLSNAITQLFSRNKALFNTLTKDDEKYRSDGCIFKDELMQRMIK